MVYFVESSKHALRTIRANLAALGIREGFEIIDREAPVALRSLDSRALTCNFCYLDPPYRQMDNYSQVLGFLSSSRLVLPETLVIAEHDKHFDSGEQFGALRRQRILRQGDSVLSFYRQE